MAPQIGRGTFTVFDTNNEAVAWVWRPAGYVVDQKLYHEFWITEAGWKEPDHTGDTTLRLSPYTQNGNPVHWNDYVSFRAWVASQVNGQGTPITIKDELAHSITIVA